MGRAFRAIRSTRAQPRATLSGTCSSDTRSRKIWWWTPAPAAEPPWTWRELGRRALGYDVHPTRKDIFRVDARKLPAELTGKADFVFIDPPYSTHLDYGPDPRDIGKLDVAGGKYYEAMEEVIGQIHRVLRPGAHMALYVSDSFVNGKGFYPIGFELFERLRRLLEPVDVVSVVRHNKTLQMGNYRKAAEEGNFFLRGFNYLFIMKKNA